VLSCHGLSGGLPTIDEPDEVSYGEVETSRDCPPEGRTVNGMAGSIPIPPSIGASPMSPELAPRGGRDRVDLRFLPEMGLL
jgi:hypothetical protein